MSYVPANNNIRWQDKVGGSKTVFEGALRVRVGGGNIAKDELPEYPNVLPQGTPTYMDELTREVKVHYEFELADVASTTTIKIVKGPEGTRIKKGMALIVEQKDMETGAAAKYTVVSVTPGEDGTDTVELDAALTAKKGDILWEADPTAKSSKYYVRVKPNGLTDVELVCVPGTYSMNVASVWGCEGPIMLRRMPNISKVVRKYMQQEEFCYFNWALHK